MPSVLEPIDTSDMLIPHNALRDAFGRAGALVGGTDSADTARVALIGTFYDNVIRFLQSHHKSEDELLWDRARERAPEHAAVIDRLAAAHRDVTDRERTAQQALAAWTAAPDRTRATTLVRALAGLESTLNAHLEDEERTFLPLAASIFSLEEWGELPGHVLRTFTGDKPWLILGLSLEQMTDAQRDVVLAHMPPPVLQMWNGPGITNFTAFIGEVRATPKTAAV